MPCLQTPRVGQLDRLHPGLLGRTTFARCSAPQARPGRVCWVSHRVYFLPAALHAPTTRSLYRVQPEVAAVSKLHGLTRLVATCRSTSSDWQVTHSAGNACYKQRRVVSAALNTSWEVFVPLGELVAHMTCRCWLLGLLLLYLLSGSVQVLCATRPSLRWQPCSNSGLMLMHLRCVACSMHVHRA